MPKIVDSEQYRKEILYKCFNLFAEEGYANVTTRKLSKELGISTGAMYHYFPSKQALFEQLVEEVSMQEFQLFKAATRGHTLLDRMQALETLLVENEDHFIKQAAIWVDFYQHHDIAEINDNPVFQKIDQRSQQEISEFLDLTDLKLARFIWTLINGILIEQLEDDSSFSFKEQIHLLTQMLLAYFEKHSPSRQ
ncbi:TetR/AcrR family transcriptional regulator [Leptolyngbyaceae cyanobacterium CCMR0082]|uniref:TetR/AcrR family transcriptional regulator n=2 Tax=Adonisia turfae TaxID=2950184 RepID=A0A6M0SBZ7_9CYAN|nr:TetR/AcrR family transcriptional regulator [Adonisia turfae]MDV3349243.1 TetR/AcrR family transcriptional regulator [Leptothoe sp. LEGE 181152]NEZ58645.1 TetR/AcrR family transcriptional regulator [Adonisia turfae CCMR0081]NEZ65511.1 TetR/AcrR family transcriptional regulator [Adonisia turfae CCMR0082]